MTASVIDINRYKRDKKLSLVKKACVKEISSFSDDHPVIYFKGGDGTNKTHMDILKKYGCSYVELIEESSLGDLYYLVKIYNTWRLGVVIEAAEGGYYYKLDLDSSAEELIKGVEEIMEQNRGDLETYIFSRASHPSSSSIRFVDNLNNIMSFYNSIDLASNSSKK